MAPVRCNLGEWLQHESTLMKPRMRQDERGRLRHLTPIIEKIEFEHGGRVSRAAERPKWSLDPLRYREQVSRGKMRCQRRDPINEPRLVRARYRLSPIPGGAGRDMD